MVGDELKDGPLGSCPIEVIWPAGATTGGETPAAVLEAAWYADNCKPGKSARGYMQAIARKVKESRGLDLDVDDPEGFLCDLALLDIVRVLRWQEVSAIAQP